MEDRRKQESPTHAEGYLRQLPALALLDRLPTAVLGVELTGQIVYANPACAEMLGYGDAATLSPLQLPQLLTGHEELEPLQCLDALRAPAPVVEWNHRDEYVIRTILSRPLLLRDTDTLLLISIIDVTEWLWESEYAQSG